MGMESSACFLTPGAGLLGMPEGEVLHQVTQAKGVVPRLGRRLVVPEHSSEGHKLQPGRDALIHRQIRKHDPLQDARELVVIADVCDCVLATMHAPGVIGAPDRRLPHDVMATSHHHIEGNDVDWMRLTVG